MSRINVVLGWHWCLRSVGWSVIQWKYVLCLKESVFQIKYKKDRPSSSQLQVWKPASVMVWVCISALGKGHLHFCDDSVLKKKKKDILEQHLLPLGYNLFQWHPWINQSDKAKPSSEHITEIWLKKKEAHTLHWPACSLDPSTVETVENFETKKCGNDDPMLLRPLRLQRSSLFDVLNTRKPF